LANLYNPEQHQTYIDTFGLDPGILGRSMWAQTSKFLGRLDEAREQSEETISIARRQRQRMSLVFALSVGVTTYMTRREPEPVLAYAEEGIRLCESLSLVTETEWIRACQGWAIGELGNLDAGIAQLRHSLDRQIALNSVTACTLFLCFLADHLLQARRIAEGHATIAEAFAFRDRTGQPHYEAEMLHIQGKLFAAEGRGADAERSLRDAIAVARRQAVLTFELRATSALARLLHAQGRSAEALRALADVYGRFTEAFDTADLRDAAALLKTLAAAVGTGAS
jgi:tetratricopeptide (TPR) repeat protein